MKILVDCSTAKMGGARTYLEALIRAVQRRRDGPSWIFYGPPGIRAVTGGAGHVEVRQAPGLCSSAAGYFVWLQALLPKIIRRDKPDAVLAATGFGMWRPPCPQAVLIRNPIYFSPLYESKVRNLKNQLDVAIRRWVSLRTIRRSQAAVFPTRAMQDLVAHYMPLEGRRCVVAPYGCEADLFRRPASPAWLPGLLAQAKGRFLLNVSLYCAQKNFTVLFESLGLLRRRGTSPPLALTTLLRPSPNTTFRQDRSILRREQLDGQVVQLGPVPRDRLPALYQSAGLFVFPSYVESFGHPLVEAMAAGLPIVAADTPVNREICRDAALYAKPFDAADWADRIAQGLSDPSARRRLAEAARRRSADFTWERHVDTLVNLCRELSEA